MSHLLETLTHRSKLFFFRSFNAKSFTMLYSYFGRFLYATRNITNITTNKQFYRIEVDISRVLNLCTKLNLPNIHIAALAANHGRLV